jgi:hypothetical protein
MRRRTRVNTNTVTNKWYDKECIDKKRAARKALNRYTCTRDELDKTAYRQLRTEYKKVICEKKRKHRQILHDRLLVDRKNSGKFWDTVKNARCKKRVQPNINLESWHDHFQSVFSGNGLLLNDKPVNDTCINERHVPQLDSPIVEDEVREAIRNLKLGKASGLDNICGEFLKCAEDVVIPFFDKVV